MITICTTILDDCKDYIPIYLESLAKRTSLVNEVLLAKADSPPSLYDEWTVGNISFKKFGTREGITRGQQGVEHGLGLHECISRSSNEYLLFHDPDVFYYCNVDKIFYDLMDKYKLNVIGVSHCSAAKFAYTFFPCLYNLLVRKSELPDKTWLHNEIREEGVGAVRNGKYLIRTENSKYNHLFPKPDGDFDTGAFLYLWAKQQNWKWLSFQTIDVHTYSLKYNRGNVKNEKLGNTKLLYHATSSTAGNPLTLEEYKLAWEKSKND